MASNFTKHLKAIDGATDFKMSEAPAGKAEGDDSRAFSGSFKFRNLVLTFQQVVSPSITMNMLFVTFEFYTSKGQERLNVLESLNAFNNSRPAIKAALYNFAESGFSVNFSMEFICPDEHMVPDNVETMVRVLSSSGTLLQGTFEQYGITINLKM